MTTRQSDVLRASLTRGNLSTACDPLLEQTVAALVSHGSELYRPYQRQDQLIVYPTDEHDTLKHVDFSDEECQALLDAVVELNGPATEVRPALSAQETLGAVTRGFSYRQTQELINHVHADPSNILQNRKRSGIKAFLSDLADGSVPSRPSFSRVEISLIDPAYNPLRSTASLLRHRELGTVFNSRRRRNLQSELRLRTSENIQPWRNWTGASGDVVACAWAPNSLTYAVGAAAPSNNEDLQYNRPRNLLLGNLISNTLEELPDHRLDRPRPEMIPDGPNSLQDTYNTADSKIYMTVSSVQFSQDGTRLFTAGHDSTARIWDVSSSGTTTCLRTLSHDNLVTELNASQHYNGLFATASKTVESSIRVYYAESLEAADSNLSSITFSSPRAQKNLKWELYPGCLRWGKTPRTSQLLLAGFQQWGETGGDCLGREGEICLWDVQSEQRLSLAPCRVSAFTAAWHPFNDMFAVGGTPARTSLLSHPHSTRSVVRTWDVRSLKRYAMEYECPALDMQDVTFNPLFPNIVTAGCTDSATYVWDFRKPDEVLLKLEHGKPISELDHTRNQEEVDPGIMMTLWGVEGARLYTGSSDGIIKCWDTSRAPEDAFIEDVASLGAGVQSGAFSPDFTHLLIGDAVGAVHVLTSAPVDDLPYFAGLDDETHPIQPIKLIKARDPNHQDTADDNPGIEGILSATELLESGQLVINRRYGVEQGPNYKGPYAKYARRDGADPSITRLLPEFDAMQPYSRHGHKNSEVAGKIRGIIKWRKKQIAEAQKSRKSQLAPALAIVKHDGRIKKETSFRRKRRFTGDAPCPPGSKRPKTQHSSSETTKVDIIDLTYLDSVSDDDGAPSSLLPRSSQSYSRHQSRNSPITLSSSDEELDEMSAGEAISDSDLWEDDHWWPRMDEEVFRRLGVKG